MEMNIEYYQKLIRDIVDFDTGYSSGETWIGYFERETDFSIEITQKIITFFVEFFDNDLSDFVVVTSFYIDKDNLMDDESIEVELSRKGYLKEIKGNQYFSKDQQVCEKQIRDLELSFRVFRGENDTLTGLSFLAMTDSNIQGHCFFVCPKLDLIIYPHSDDTGYGCIGIKSKDNKVGIEFLKVAGKYGFNSCVKYNGQIQKISD